MILVFLFFFFRFVRRCGLAGEYWVFWKLKTDGSSRRFSNCLLGGETTRTRTFAVSGTATLVFGVPCERRKGGRRDGQRFPGAPAGFPHCLRSRCYDRKRATRGLAEPKTPQGKGTIQDLVVYFFSLFLYLFRVRRFLWVERCCGKVKEAIQMLSCIFVAACFALAFPRLWPHGQKYSSERSFGLTLESGRGDYPGFL